MATKASPTPSAQAIQPSPNHAPIAKPITVATKCPPTMARGCANGESGKPNARTQLAPKGAMSQGTPDSALSQPVMAIFVEAAPVGLRPLAYIDFIVHWVQEDDFYGCAFINATAEYAQTDEPPHQRAAAHKKEICDYLIGLCAAAGAKQPAAVAMPIYLIGEGLIVACQVQGHNASLLDAARTLARSVTLETAVERLQASGESRGY